MKISFSRKGFDSQYGGMPSPILPDGRLVPLPIPSDHDSFAMQDLHLPGVDLDELLKDLSRGRWTSKSFVHLDPDLDRAPDSRISGWRPSLGQTGTAQAHLARQGFGVGDVFLFFGWFRKVEHSAVGWRYARTAPDLHLIFGWLEVDEVLSVVTDRARCLKRHPWISDHPHVSKPEHYDSRLNHLYVSALKSRFQSKTDFGAGRFPSFRDCLQLTKSGERRTVWSLPGWFMPRNGRPPMTYHPLGTRWASEDEGVILKSAAKGQEFVLDANCYPEADPWITNIVLGGI